MTIHMEGGIITGNIVDKDAYKTRVPYKYFLRQYDQTLLDLVELTQAQAVLEVGCGEGRLARLLASATPHIGYRGIDLSSRVIQLARKQDLRTSSQYIVRDLYASNGIEPAELVLCCQVLEHLNCPRQALDALHRLTEHYLIISVPAEPWWRIANICRGAYLTSFGNTPGHVNHWTKGKIARLVMTRFQIVASVSPHLWHFFLLEPKR